MHENTANLGTRRRGARHLIADVFDFLYEARPLIIKGKLEERLPPCPKSIRILSLLVSGKLEPTLIDRWISGDQIGHSRFDACLLLIPAAARKRSKLENSIIFFVRRPIQTEATCLTVGFWEKEPDSS